MTAKKLRAVSPNEAPISAPKAKTVSEAAESGSTRDLLIAMRNRIAVAVSDPNTPARDLAALTKRLAEVVRELEALGPEEKTNGDEGNVKPDRTFNPAAI